MIINAIFYILGMDIVLRGRVLTVRAMSLNIVYVVLLLKMVKDSSEKTKNRIMNVEQGRSKYEGK
ncbi:hypothetical protein OAC89_06960 [Deltaproteobacteria bacterium]|nr:hypothetical protein [Deltaproteobacteria bacterium]